ncbi:zinc finger BED domain-containing protein RICESLEEPER 2-like [Capsicum galapagoense]
MAASITYYLLEWDLDTVFSITVDNASSNDVTMIEMSKQLSNCGTNIMEDQHLHVRCMAHILNLIVQDGLKEIDKPVKRVRQAVKYVKQSAARVKKFKECCESQLITCKKSLCLDVPTRWNSTYLMLETTQYFELAFERYSFYDNGFLDYLCTSPCEDGSKAGAFVNEDWENVRTMVRFLKTFCDLTLKVSGSKYVTTNVHFVEIAKLNLILKEMIENEDSNLKKMVLNMREKFRKYWGTLEKMNKMVFISSVLDPRNKLEYVSFAIVDKFGKEIGDKLFDSVESYMKALFEHYIKKSKNSSSSPSSFYSGNSSSINGYGNFQKKKLMRTKQKFEKHKEISGGSSNKSKLGKYVAEEIEPDLEHLIYYVGGKLVSLNFPFSLRWLMMCWVIDPFRSSLTPKLVQSLICLQDWLRSESTPINIEEDIEYLEQLEKWLVAALILALLMCSCQ